MNLPSNLSIPLISAIVGTAILLFGRKLFWLFLAALGFAVGLQVATYVMHDPPLWATLTISLILGFLGALLALMVQKFAVAVAGFIAGGRLASALLTAFFADHAHYQEITFVIGGILGALLLLVLFDWVLIFLSSIEGAHLVVTALTLPQTGSAILFAALALIGLLVQGSMFRNARQSG